MTSSSTESPDLGSGEPAGRRRGRRHRQRQRRGRGGDTTSSGVTGGLMLGDDGGRRRGRGRSGRGGRGGLGALGNLGRRHDDGPPTFGGGRLDFAPRPMRFVEERDDAGPSMFAKPRRRIDIGAILAGLFGLGTLLFVGSLIYRGTRVEVDVTGIEDGGAVTSEQAAELVVALDVGSGDRAGSATLTFDGEVVEEPEVEGEVITWRSPGPLEEGDHELRLEVPRPVLGAVERRWEFAVDGTAPELELTPVGGRVALDQATTVAGTAEPGSTVTADGREADVDGEGRFTLDFARPPAGPIDVVATDRAGNTTTTPFVVPVAYPATRAVQMTAASWESRPLRDGIFQMLAEGRIDTVVVDLKDQEGVVGYDTTVARAREVGAVTTYYDLEDLVASVEARGGRVVGRISTFRDPILARAAWGAGQGDQVVQTPDGRPYEEPGIFTNFAHPAVRQYNLDIALDAVSRGVDDILWDDVRKPGSAEDTMLVPGLTGSPADALTGFLAEAHAQLRRRGAFQGVALEGIAATDGALVGQDTARMSRNADWIMPTVHPAYWSDGSFGVGDPARQPYDLVLRAVERYKQLATGSGTTIVPNLQDFNAGGVSYGDPEVRAQIDAALAGGLDKWVLWDPAVTYSAGALPPAPAG
jgi:hypothetical protein